MFFTKLKEKKNQNLGGFTVGDGTDGRDRIARKGKIITPI